MADEPFIDPITLGRLFRAARIMAGYSNVSALADALVERTGVQISARTIYAIERGTQVSTVDQFLALAYTLHPPGGVRFFHAAYRIDLVEFISAPYLEPHGVPGRPAQ